MVIKQEKYLEEESSPMFGGARWRTSMAEYYVNEVIPPELLKELTVAVETGLPAKPVVKEKSALLVLEKAI